MTHRRRHYSPYYARRSSPRGSRDFSYEYDSSPAEAASLLRPLEGVTYVPRRASDTLVAPRTFRPALEDYYPLRRKSDTLDVPVNVPLAVSEDMSISQRRGSADSRRSSGQGSQDTLVLPAVTVSTVGEDIAAGAETLGFQGPGRPCDSLMLPSVTVTADPSDSAWSMQEAGSPSRPYSLTVPATRVRNVLMVRGRRNSSVAVAGAVFGHALVGLDLTFTRWLLFFSPQLAEIQS